MHIPSYMQGVNKNNIKKMTYSHTCVLRCSNIKINKQNRHTNHTSVSRELNLVIKIEIKNYIKKKYLWPKRRQMRRLGPFSSSWACVGRRWLLWAFPGFVVINK